MKAIIFDMDDTLLHLDVLWGAVEEEMRKCIGEHRTDIDPNNLSGSLLNEKDEALKTELNQIMERYERNGWQNATLMPNAKETIEYLSQKYALGIVTGNGVYVATKVLEKFDLTEYFKAVATREDGVKPAPTPIFTALEKIGCETEDAVYVGNSKSDMAASKAAGIRAIGYSSTLTSEELKDSGADSVIADLTELKELIE